MFNLSVSTMLQKLLYTHYTYNIGSKSIIYGNIIIPIYIM